MLRQGGHGVVLCNHEARTGRFRKFLTKEEAKANILEYIEVFCSPAKAGHSTLGYMSPVELEKVNKLS